MLPLLPLPVQATDILSLLEEGLEKAASDVDGVVKLRRAADKASKAADKASKAADEARKAADEAVDRLERTRDEIRILRGRVPPHEYALTQQEVSKLFNASEKVLGQGGSGQTRLISIDGIPAVCKRFSTPLQSTFADKRRVLLSASDEFRWHMAVWNTVDDDCKRNMTRPFNMKTRWDYEASQLVLDAFDDVGALPREFYTVQGFAADEGRTHSVQGLLSGIQFDPEVRTWPVPPTPEELARMRLNNFLPTRPPPPDQFPTRPPPPDQSSEQREQERRSGFLLACRLGAMVGHAMACTHRAGYV